jgi:hypothetical protein
VGRIALLGLDALGTIFASPRGIFGLTFGNLGIILATTTGWKLFLSGIADWYCDYGSLLLLNWLDALLAAINACGIRLGYGGFSAGDRTNPEPLGDKLGNSSRGSAFNIRVPTLGMG